MGSYRFNLHWRLAVSVIGNEPALTCLYLSLTDQGNGLCVIMIEKELSLTRFQIYVGCEEDGRDKHLTPCFAETVNFETKQDEEERGDEGYIASGCAFRNALVM